MPDILSWGFLATIALACVGFAFAVLQFGQPSTDEFWIARGCFLIAAIIGLGRITLWALTTSRDIGIRVVVGIVAWGLIAAFAIEAVRYVNRKHARWNQGQVESQRPLPPQPRPSVGSTDVAATESSPGASSPSTSQATATQKTGEAEKQIMVSVPIGQLIDSVADHTMAEADRLMAPYIGKWIRVSGLVDDVTEEAAYWLVFIQLPESHRLVALSFNTQTSMNQVSVLRKGEQLNVLGKIKKISSVGTPTLSNCEIV